MTARRLHVGETEAVNVLAAQTQRLLRRIGDGRAGRRLHHAIAHAWVRHGQVLAKDDRDRLTHDQARLGIEEELGARDLG